MGNAFADNTLLSELRALRLTIDQQQQEITHLAAQLADREAAAQHALSRANDASNTTHSLQSEITALRASARKHSDLLALPSKEWSIALRRAADKYDRLETDLRERILELHQVKASCYKANLERDEAITLLHRTQAEREHDLQRSRSLELALEVARQEKAMMELAMSDYADLVRSMTISNPTSPTSPTSNPSKTLSQGLSGLSRLFSEHSSETERLQARVSLLQSELDRVKIELLAEQEYQAQIHTSAAYLQAKVSGMEADDGSASKIVSRYMKFSQESTNALQQTLVGLRTRHAATIESLESQLSTLQHSLATERTAHERTQILLSKAQSQVILEQDAKRCEVSLRIKSIDQMAHLLHLLDRFLDKYLPSLRQIQGDNREIHPLITSLLDELERLHADFGDFEGTHRKLLSHYIRFLQEQHRLEDFAKPQKELSVSDDFNSTSPEQTGSHPTRDLLDLLPLEKDGEHLALSAVTGAGGLSASPHLTSKRKDFQPVIRGDADVMAIETTQCKSIDVPVCHPSSSGIPRASVDLPGPHPSNTEPSPLPSSIPSSDKALGSHLCTGFATPSDLISSPTLHDTPPAPHPITPPSGTNPGHLSSLELLSLVIARYDSLQESLQACHLAISGLKDNFFVLQSSKAIDSSSIKQFELVINRLDDYNEDTRVELEIGIADEGRVAQGFATLLVIPDNSEKGKQSWQTDMVEFLSNDYPPFRDLSKAVQTKLEDTKHDINVLQEQLRRLAEERPPSIKDDGVQSSTWTNWANGVLSPSPSRPASPSPSFGSVMSSRSNRQHLPPRLDAGGSSIDFSELGLRVSMPVVHRPHTIPNSKGLPSTFFTSNRSVSFGLGLSRHFSPLTRPSSLSVVEHSECDTGSVGSRGANLDNGDANDVE